MVCCIEAAELELQPKLQQLLLRAAAYGKCYLPSRPSTATDSGDSGDRGDSGAGAGTGVEAGGAESAAHLFVSACKRIRVLNAVRHSHGP